MRHPSLLAALVLAPLSLVAAITTTACGEDSRVLPTGDAGAGGTSQAQGGTNSGGSGTTGGNGGSGTTGVTLCDGAAAPTNSDICPLTVPQAPTCGDAKSKPVQLCGVLAKIDKTTDSARSADTEEYAGTGPIDTACFEKANWKSVGPSKTVTLKGFVRNFSNGCDAKNVQIEVYTVKRGGADDGAPDQLIGTPVITASDACAGEPGCKLVDVEKKCTSPRIWRAYEYPNVPTETELLIKTSSPPDVQKPDYAPLYDYNVYIANDDTGVAEGTHERPLRAVSIGDFSLIPQVAYGAPITAGNGAVAGEIHDCGDVRITGATFGVSRKGAADSYFTNDENAPLPDQQATSTSLLGLYAAYDLTPGPVRVVATARIAGAQTSLGYYDVRVFPNAITSMTFRGFRPFQAASAGK